MVSQLSKHSPQGWQFGTWPVKPRLQRLHRTPSTPSRQSHWPVSRLHCVDFEPIGSQLQAGGIENVITLVKRALSPAKAFAFRTIEKARIVAQINMNWTKSSVEPFSSSFPTKPTVWNFGRISFIPWRSAAHAWDYRCAKSGGQLEFQTGAVLHFSDVTIQLTVFCKSQSNHKTR